MSKLFNIAEQKQRLSYASGWVGIFGVPLLVVNLIQEKLLLINIKVPLILLFALSAVGLWLIGYISEEIGLIKAEANWSWKQQEEMQKSLKK